jgi:hypothetical protein
MMASPRPLRILRPHRRGLLRVRPNDHGIAALLLRCPDGSDGKLDSRLARACVRTRRTNGSCGQTCQCGLNVTGGVGGLIPQTEAAPLPHLSSYADFFWVSELLNYFLKFKDSNGGSAIYVGKSTPSGDSTATFDHLFSRRPGRPFSEKMSRNSPGGRGYVMTAFYERGR